MQKRDLALVVLVLAVGLAVAFLVWRGSVLETGSWGLSFREPGQPPIGNAGMDQLASYNALYLADPTQNTIYLTFDAGYENGCTEKILDILKEKNVKAVFFLVGNYLDRNPDLVRRMAEEGHTVGNHTLTHPDMSKIADPDSFRRELEGLEEKYRQVTGLEMKKLYRPPQGIYSRENLAMARDMGYKTVFWSLAYVDWKNDAQPTKEEAMKKLTERIHPGAIVLLHSTSQTNARILGEVIDAWREMGYELGDLGAV